MNADIKALWVAALKSGDYEQNIWSKEVPLRTTNNRWSALGVLCNLHAQAHPEEAAKQEEVDCYYGNQYNLPRKVREWAGVGSTVNLGVEFRIYGGCYDYVAEMDDAHIPFDIIADAIENNL